MNDTGSSLRSDDARLENLRRVAGTLGLSAVLVFGITLFVFSFLNPEFHWLNDYVSMLGAKGQPYSLWWNLIGFLSVGILFASFGWAFGLLIQDRWVGLALALFGVGFAATAVPVDLDQSESALSKMHIVAICMGMAAWFFGLARMAQLSRLGKLIHRTANVAALFAVLPVAAHMTGMISAPVAHRFVFLVVFAWTVMMSVWMFVDSVGARHPASVTE